MEDLLRPLTRAEYALLTPAQQAERKLAQTRAAVIRMRERKKADGTLKTSYNYHVAMKAKYKGYGTTPEEVAAHAAHGCAICGRELTLVKDAGKELRAVVDHCHESNKFRGVLCNYCNLGLGNFKDNPEALRKAATYLENFYART